MRAAIHAYHFPDEAAARRLLRDARAHSTRRLEQILADAVFILGLEGEQFRHGFDAGAGPRRLVDVLEDLLVEARQLTGPGDLRLQVEYRLVQALVSAHGVENEREDARRRASELLSLASLVGIPSVMEGAAATHLFALSCAGHYHEEARERRALLGLPGVAAETREAHALSLAVALANVGNVDAALATLTDVPEGPRMGRRAAAHASFIRSWWGWEHPDAAGQGAEETLGRLAWMARAMRFVTTVGTLEPLRRLRKERATLYRDALAASEAGRASRLPTDAAFERWVRALCRLHLGEFGLARQELASPPVLHEEELLTRTLLVGARLELALVPGPYEVEGLLDTEAELRAVFTLASRLEFASQGGLAWALRRWHLVAAAYAALVLTNHEVPALRAALDAVVRVGEGCAAYHQVLPGPFVAETLLASLGVDVPPHPRMNADDREKKRALLVEERGVPYWRPVVTGAQLAYGLVKAGRLAEAREALADFGGVPELDTAYLASTLRVLESALNRLTSGEADRHEFEVTLSGL